MHADGRASDGFAGADWPDSVRSYRVESGSKRGVVVLVTHPGEQRLAEAVRLGVEVLVGESLDGATLAYALDMAAADQAHSTRDIIPALFRALGFVPDYAPGEPITKSVRLLNDRELQAAAFAAQGHMNKEIAARMCASEPTIKRYLGSVFDKLHIRGRGELRVLAAYLHAALVDGAADLAGKLPEILSIRLDDTQGDPNSIP